MNSYSALLIIICYMINKETTTAHSVYFNNPLPWFHGQQYCSYSGKSLSVVKNLGEIAGVVNSTNVGAWLGGRRVSTPWVWTDNTTLYTSYGCFPDEVVKPLMSQVVLKVHDVFECFLACGSNAVATKLERCLCLREVPGFNKSLDETKCPRKCEGNFHDNCGDAYTLSVYQRDQLSYTLSRPAWSANLSSTSKCGYFQRDKGNGSAAFSLMFAACGNRTKESKKRLFCQQCSDEIQQGTPQNCTLYKWTGPRTWEEAFDFCRAKQMSLITPTSGESFLNKIKGKQPFWVGLRSDITLSWIDGSTLNPDDFALGLRDFDGDCVSVFLNETASPTLQLEDCKKSKPYLCDTEITEQSSTTSSLEATLSTAELPEMTTEYLTTATQTSPTSTEQSLQTARSNSTNFTESTNTSMIVNHTTSPGVNSGLREGKKHHKKIDFTPIYISLAVFLTILLVALAASVLYLAHKRSSKSASLPATIAYSTGASTVEDVPSVSITPPKATEELSQDEH